MGWADGKALFDWCEPNYVHSSQIAEFFNTLTNLAYCVVGVLTLLLPQQDQLWRLRLSGMALFGVGVGSMAFHGTLTRLGQAADELAIVYWEVALLFCVFERQLLRRHWLGKCAWALLAAETVLYFQMDAYPKVGWALYHPLHATVGFAVAMGALFQASGCKRTQKYLLAGLLFMAVAFGSWLLDMFWCDSTQHLFLHAFGWHLNSAAAIAAFHAAVACQVCRQKKLSSVSLLGLVDFGVDASSSAEAASASASASHVKQH